MIYRDYKCNKCGKKQTIKQTSILEEKPKALECLEDNCTGVATYDWSQLKGNAIIIKDHMKAGGSQTVKYNKIPKENRKFK